MLINPQCRSLWYPWSTKVCTSQQVTSSVSIGPSSRVYAHLRGWGLRSCGDDMAWDQRAAFSKDPNSYQVLERPAKPPKSRSVTIYVAFKYIKLIIAHHCTTYDETASISHVWEGERRGRMFWCVSWLTGWFECKDLTKKSSGTGYNVPMMDWRNPDSSFQHVSIHFLK